MNEICPITGLKSETSITLYKRNFYFIFIQLKKKEVGVSYKGKEIYLNSLSTGWIVFDFISNILVHIPFVGGILIICVFSMCFLYGLPIVAILDLILKKKVLGRGVLLINNKHEIVLNK